MTWLGTIASNVLRMVYTDVPPSIVQEVKPENYSNRHIECREDGIVLYGPGEKMKKNMKLFFIDLVRKHCIKHIGK